MYILKFVTDGAVLTKTKNAVQGTMKLIPSDENGRVIIGNPDYSLLDKEFTLYYYIGSMILQLLIHVCAKINHGIGYMPGCNCCSQRREN